MKESELVRSIRELLTIFEWNKKICWWERLNSGKILSQAGPARYMVQLCRTGTPDFIVMRIAYCPGEVIGLHGDDIKCEESHTIVDFLECKTAKGKLRPEQEEFFDKTRSPEKWANFYTIRDIDEVVKLYGGEE